MNDFQEQVTPGGIILLTTHPLPEPPPHDPALPAELKEDKCPVCGSNSPNQHEMTCMGANNAVHCDDCGWYGVDQTWGWKS